jgi:pimeloyl-ACP methyl ester carboxylesterase
VVIEWGGEWSTVIALFIARGYTTKDKLFIFGGSAGGITTGRALTERPDLFAGVINIVPGANTLRSEFSPNGPLNIPEFGTIKTEEGFKNLYEMDTIQPARVARAGGPLSRVRIGEPLSSTISSRRCWRYGYAENHPGFVRRSPA